MENRSKIPKIMALVLFMLIFCGVVVCNGSAYGVEYYVAKTGNDANSGTPASPFATIQHAIERATSGDVVYVQIGVYSENIMMKSGVNVIGSGPDWTSIVGSPSVNGVVLFDNVQNAILKKFKITVSSHIGGTDRAVVFQNNTDSTAVLRNCVIAGVQYGIFVWAPAVPSIVNNTLVKGDYAFAEQGIQIINNYANQAYQPVIYNNIIAGFNYAGIHAYGAYIVPTPDIEYNDVWNNNPNHDGCTPQTGNISADPFFYSGDFHLYSGSPCINTGNPATQYNDPDGSRNDMGAYGGPYNTTPCAYISASPASPMRLYVCERQITTDLGDQFDPSISDNIIVYSDNRGIDTDVYYYDLAIDREVQVSNAAGDQFLSDISNGLIVFDDLQITDVLLYSTFTGATTNLTISSNSVSLTPAIGDGIVAWEDNRNSGKQIYARNLVSGEERRISTSPNVDDRPATSNGIIVWQSCSVGICDIYAYYWNSGTTRQISNTPTGDERRRPHIHGNRVVYDALRNGERDICFFDLSTDTEKCLSLPGEQVNPHISGDFVSFEDLSTGSSHMKLWHLPTDSVFQVTTGPGAQFLNDIDGNRIVYTDDRNGQLDIYMVEFNLPPVAKAGASQTVHVGALATLDGSASYDPDGNTPLTFAWTITSAPSGSAVALSDPTSVSPSFTPDKQGNYTITLVVSDSLGLASVSDNAIISTYNSVPVADAGPDQALIRLGTVQLDGSKSYDPDGDPITYKWTITAKPLGSSAVLSNAAAAKPTFLADRYGDYVIAVVVTDSFGAQSDVDSVTASFANVRPVANAGENQAVAVGATVSLDEGASSDANNDPLTYQWSIISKPDGSAATLSNETTVTTSFKADKPGSYVVSLVVNDGLLASDPSNVSIIATVTKSQVGDKLKDAEDAINNLDPNAFKNPNMKNALTNKINTVLELIDQGLYSDALDKLENDIIQKTDGCAKTGAPDKNDWITTCIDQQKVYPIILQAIELLRDLL